MKPLDDHNRNLVQNVHPPDWKNPEPAPRYNLVVVGGGTAGLVTAAGAAGLGARVALIERGLLGGDCLNTGCVPSKAMIRSGRVLHEQRRAGDFGFDSKKADADFRTVMERMRMIRAGMSVHDSAQRFSRELGVDVFFGEARFSGKNSIKVTGIDLRFKKAAICTGARAAVPQIPGISETGCLTSETVFELTELPPSIAVIGAGPIGCELAQTFARLGSAVSLVETSGRVLPREDRDAAGIVQEALLRDGVRCFFNTNVVQTGKKGADKVVVMEQKGTAKELTVQEILIAVGRVPNVDGLGLEQAGIAFDRSRGVFVNDQLRTSNRNVYAAGDVCSSYKFTHAADAMARIVIANSLFMGRQKLSKLVIPWCIFTDPELAHVGMREEDAGEKGKDVVTLTVPLSVVDRAVLDGESKGFARVHLKKGSDRILGATIVARNAGEMINEVTLAITAGTGLSAIGKTIHPYPTLSEAVRKLGDQYNKTRLTPLIKQLLAAWLHFQRKI